MASNTGIEWTDATWNPVVGCSIVSPGCTNCYAMQMAARIETMQPASHYAGTTKSVHGHSVWTGKVALAPDHILTAPLRWKKPRRIFVNSMGDLFHESVPDAWIDRVFAVMALCPQHTFQVLTKRSRRMREYCGDIEGSYNIATAILDLLIDRKIDGKITDESNPLADERADDDPALKKWPLPNVWLGVSAEDQTRADERIPDLLTTPAAVRFVSAEPLLSAVDFTSIKVGGADSLYRANALTGDGVDGQRLSWIIAGGESGPEARPMHPDWVRAIRDQCKDADTPFFFKQWGEWAPGENCDFAATRTERTAAWFADRWSFSNLTPRESEEMHRDDAPDLYRIGKRRAGHLLDGIEHREFPK